MYKEVFYEQDYSKFKIKEENIKEGKLERLLVDIVMRGTVKPILVNSDFVIIDGVARFKVLQNLNRPIPYVIKK